MTPLLSILGRRGVIILIGRIAGWTLICRLRDQACCQPRRNLRELHTTRLCLKKNVSHEKLA